MFKDIEAYEEAVEEQTRLRKTLNEQAIVATIELVNKPDGITTRKGK